MCHVQSFHEGKMFDGAPRREVQTCKVLVESAIANSRRKKEAP